MKVLACDKVDAAAIARIRSAGHEVVEGNALKGADLVAALAGVQGLLVRGATKVTADVFPGAPTLKVVVRAGTGLDNVDQVAAAAHGVEVRNTPNANSVSVAELVFGMLLAIERHLLPAANDLKRGVWEKSKYQGRELSGRTLGLLGFGRIGKAMAKRARAFDLKVIYWNRTRLSAAEEQAMDVTYQPFDEVVAASDFLSLHVAYNKDTHHLVGERQLAAMKSTAIIINTARGPVIDEKALVRALAAKRIGGAGLDVFEKEPALEPELYSLDNAVVVPHLGSATIGTRTKMGMLAAQNLLAVCSGQRPPHCVNPQIYG